MKQLEAAWGVALGPVPNRIRENLQLRGGVMVTDLQNGAWARQGIRKGFIVLRIDGSPVKGLQEWRDAVPPKTTKRDSCSKACIPMAAGDLRALPSL